MPKVNNKFRGAEHAARISYLYQAAELVVAVAPNSAQHFGQTMKIVSQKTKTPAKLDYTLKRSICKKCKQVLVVGKSATYRLKRRKRGKKQKGEGYPTQIIKCQSCQTVKSFSTNPNYQLFKRKEKVKKDNKKCMNENSSESTEPVVV